ncbi:MAG: hypothetical protein HQL64_16405 [Magnetococcales bacterium]|nr:hypothetical protein [Magnetococcales bacterium]
MFFYLANADDAFRLSLRQYAAALDLASTSSGTAKSTYEAKASTSLQKLVKWLQENETHAFEVEYQGRRKILRDWAKGHSLRELSGIGASDRINFRDMINIMSGTLLATHFKDQAPDYPHFSLLVTSANRKQAAQDALRGIATGNRTRQATAVLDALELLDGDRLEPINSRYAKYMLDLLEKKPPGQVVNRVELIQSEYGVEYLASTSLRLELEWCAVILGALVHAGELLLTIPGKKFDASNLNELAACSVDDLVGFKHVERPREWDIPAIKALFEIVGLTTGLAQLVSQGKPEPIQELQSKVTAVLQRLVITGQRLQGGLPFWGQTLLSESLAGEYKVRLGEIKAFLESLQGFTTPGRLKNLKFNALQIRAHQDGFSTLIEGETLYDLVNNLGPLASWLSIAETVLPTEHEWVLQMRKARQEIIGQLIDPKARGKAAFAQQTKHRLIELKNAFIAIYGTLHTRARLGINEEKKATAIKRDPRTEQLKRLATIDLMPSTQLSGFQNQLAALKICHRLTQQELDVNPVCPHCAFRPNAESGGAPMAERLNRMETELESMAAGWTRSLLDNLEDPTTQENLALLKPDARKRVDAFVQSRTLPDPLDQDFIHAVREVLSGLEKIDVSDQRLRDALLAGGSPATVEELRERFDRFLTGLIKGKEPGKVRIVLGGAVHDQG